MLKKYCLILLVFTLWANFSVAQLAVPEVSCASVLPNGDMVFQWQPPADPNNTFFNYEVFIDDGNGFQSQGMWGGISNTNYTYYAGDANTQSYAFYVVVQSAGGTLVSAPSDTLRTLHLTVGATALSSVALLSWNDLAVAGGTYEIWRNHPVTGWSNIATLPEGSNSYTDTLYGFCEEAEVLYQVRHQRPGSTCYSESNVAGDYFQDLMGPDVPLIETISINPLTGDLEIFWYPSSAPDTDYYLIQSVSGSNYINVGQVNVGEATYFSKTYQAQQSANLVVIAFDNCENDNSYNFINQTMFLQSEYDLCRREISLEWNAYTGWLSGVSEYRIHRSTNSSADEIVAVLPSDQLTFMEDSVSLQDTYCYWVEAVSNSDERASYSNKSCVETTYPGLISYNYLSSVSVSENNRIQVHLLQDPQGENTRYELQRKAPASESYFTVLERMQSPEVEFIYTDPEVKGSSGIYSYRWLAYDPCGQLISQSNTGHNILLGATVDSINLENRLWWNEYSGWEGGVISYEIYRRQSPAENFELLTVVGPQTFSYIDQVENQMSGGGYFEYKIVAVEGENSFEFSATAASNSVWVSQPPIVWIPNAIILNHPDPRNRIFKPVASFIDTTTFSMHIFNKWSQEIFATSDLDTGWNGHYNGRKAPQDYFRYVIEYKSKSGQPYRKTGVVYVFYNTRE